MGIALLRLGWFFGLVEVAMSGVACYAIFGLVVAAFGFVLLFVGRDDKKN